MNTNDLLLAQEPTIRRSQILANTVYPWHSHPSAIAQFCVAAQSPKDTARYYCDYLGFKFTQIHADGYLVERYGQSIFLGYPQASPADETRVLYIRVPDLSIYNAFYGINPLVRILKELTQMPNGEMQFSVMDCDENCIIFYSSK